MACLSSSASPAASSLPMAQPRGHQFDRRSHPDIAGPSTLAQATPPDEKSRQEVRQPGLWRVGRLPMLGRRGLAVRPTRRLGVFGRELGSHGQVEPAPPAREPRLSHPRGTGGLGERSMPSRASFCGDAASPREPAEVYGWRLLRL
jgi:hypothetical protein